MYLHLGNEIIIRTEDLIGIFDIEGTTVSKHSRSFLNKAAKKDEAVTVSYELPKSFIVCKAADEERQRVYISQISVSTLVKRAELDIIE